MNLVFGKFGLARTVKSGWNAGKINSKNLVEVVFESCF